MQPQQIKHGIGTKIGIIISTAALIPPMATQVVALVENTSAHWSQADKTSLISGAAVAGILIVSKTVQAAIVLFKGGSA